MGSYVELFPHSVGFPCKLSSYGGTIRIVKVREPRYFKILTATRIVTLSLS